MSSSSFRLILLMTLLIAPMSIFAAYTPSATTYLYGGAAPDMLFSNPNPWPPGSPAPVRMDANYILHGDVWSNDIGWSTFDHSVP